MAESCVETASEKVRMKVPPEWVYPTPRERSLADSSRAL